MIEASLLITIKLIGGIENDYYSATQVAVVRPVPMPLVFRREPKT
jgi:hypothetical protein